MRRLLRIGRLQVLLAWYDLWVGAYYDAGHCTLYVCPLPTLVLRLELPGEHNEALHSRSLPAPTASEGSVE